MREYLTLHRSVFPSYLTIESGRMYTALVLLPLHVHYYRRMISDFFFNCFFFFLFLFCFV